MLLYWRQNICEPELRYSKRGREDGKQKGEKEALCAIASPPSPHHGWLTANIFVTVNEARAYLVAGININ
jgi:hypothetical protein